MNRKTVTIAATLVALILLAGTGVAGFTATPILQQPPGSGPIDVDVWLAHTGSTEPVRRLDPGTTEAQIVVESDLKAGQVNRFRVKVFDATGTVVFTSNELELEDGPHTRTVAVTGKGVFDTYVERVEETEDNLVNRVASAVSEAEGDNPSPSQVRVNIQTALTQQISLGLQLDRIRAFDLSADGNADAQFAAAEADLTDVANRGNEAHDLLWADPIDWNSVRAKLADMQAATDSVSSQINAGLGDLDSEADRGFPPTGVDGQCNQNIVQLLVAGTDNLPSADFWWTVGTPGEATRLATPEEPESSSILQPEFSVIYSTLVGVADVPHSSGIEVLALDSLCLPVSGVPVSFDVPADSIATLVAVQPTTDANGVAKAIVHATDQLGDDGTVDVVVSTESAVATTHITVVGPPASIRFVTAPRIPVYGTENVEETAVVLNDANGNHVANGTPVHLSIDPPHHSFSESGTPEATIEVARDGRAGDFIITGSSRGLYTIHAASGDANDAQAFRVSGPPEQIELEASPEILAVNTPRIEDRTGELTARLADSEGQPAPDDTWVEFEYLDPEDADYLGLSLDPRQKLYIQSGQVTVEFVGIPTSYRAIELKATAFYEYDSGPISLSDEITIIVRGESIFLPLVRR